ADGGARLFRGRFRSQRNTRTTKNKLARKSGGARFERSGEQFLGRKERQVEKEKRSADKYRRIEPGNKPRDQRITRRAESKQFAMRVIAGRAGGVPLVSPKNGVRPTMDRVKEAIFSSLGEMVTGARVLDLFAGTGALGIEASVAGLLPPFLSTK